VTDPEDEIEIEVVDDRASAGSESDGRAADRRRSTEDDRGEVRETEDDRDGASETEDDRTGVRGTEDDRPENAAGASIADDRSLGDELGSLRIHTTPEGYVEGRVTALESVDASTVRLEVSLPHGGTAEFTLEKPIPWSREFLLARIVEDVGYDAASVEYLVGETVLLERTDVGEPAEGGRLAAVVGAAGDSLVASLSGGRYRLADRRNPQWRLVDPLERPTDDGGLPVESIATLLVLLGAVVAVVGALLGATGTLALSAPVVGYTLPGIALVLVGLSVLRNG